MPSLEPKPSSDLPGGPGADQGWDNRLALMKPKLRPSQNLMRWFTPGLHVKRWLLLLFAAIVMISLAVGYLLRDFYSGGFRFPEWVRNVSLQFLPRSIRALLFAVAGAGLLLLAFPFAAEAQQPIVIKFSHVTTPDTPKGKGAEKFKELAEKYTGGKVKVEVYPNSQLYKDKEEIEALQLAAVQMLAPSTAKFAPLGAKEFEALDLPFLFANDDEYTRISKGPVGQWLFQKLVPKGITGLAFWDNGFKDFSANRSIKVPADYKGLKMRIQSSKVLGDEIKALGAIPQVMAFSEVYQALQTGVVDGTENPPSNFYTQKMNEVQKYLALTDHGVIEYAVIVNKKFWDGLPADVRTTLEGAMKDATKYANDIAKKENDDALEAVRKSGKTQILTLSADEKNQLKKVLLPVHKENESRIGKDIIAEVYKATDFKP